MIAARLALVATLMSAPIASAQVLDFAALDGWQADDLRPALSAFRVTCNDIDGPGWQPVCAAAARVPDTPEAARAFFEVLFRPVLIGTPPALFTGYYEPELPGSPVRTPRFAWPIYAKPPELTEGSVWHPRAEIEARGLLRGRGLEIAWLDDPVEVFFLMVQGSGRIRMPDGSVLRVGYAAKNGQPYRSIGQELVRRGTHTLDQVSAQEIKAWVRQNPAAGAALLDHNPSYVFFRRLPSLSHDAGPIGAMGRSVTPWRTIAVDPAFVPLGAPVWVEADGATKVRRLMIAQDTGSAIKGAQRADIYTGSGQAAGEIAGTMKDGGRMLVLLPADALLAED